MLNYYGDKTPLRLLDEATFWKLQEKEHTVVIREITTGLEAVYVESLQEWEEAFAQVEGVIVKLTEAAVRSKGEIDPKLSKEIMEVIKFSRYQSKQFVKFLHYLVENSTAVKNNKVAIVVINHIRRESEYFIGITKAFLKG